MSMCSSKLENVLQFRKCHHFGFKELVTFFFLEGSARSTQEQYLCPDENSTDREHTQAGENYGIRYLLMKSALIPIFLCSKLS